MTGRVAQVSLSSGGVPKHPVPHAEIRVEGLLGDGHRDREHHGGPERAVCLYAMELIEGLRGEGHTVDPGSLGENLTLEGVDWESLAPEACVRVGEHVVLQITRYTSPCFNIQRAFVGGQFARISHKRHPGWSRLYARVLRPGTVRPGDRVEVLTAPEAEALAR